METYDRIYELLEELQVYYQHLAPSYDLLPKRSEAAIVGHLEKALAGIQRADPFEEEAA